jgi:hypothetical protein
MGYHCQRGTLCAGNWMLKLYQIIAGIAALVLLLSFLGLGYYSSPPGEYPSEQQAAAGQKDAQQNQEAGKGLTGFWSWLFKDSISVFTLWLSLATVALGAIAAIQLGYLRRAERIAAQSAKAAETSAKVAYETLVATNRPWVSADLKIAGPLTYNETEARIEIAFVLKNTGLSPAVNVQVDAEMALFMENGTSPLDRMKEICKRAKQSPDDNPVLGHTIFKDRDFTYLINLPMPKERVRNAFDNFPDIEKGSNDWFSPSVVGCVSYRFPFERGRHVTEFIAEIRKNNPENPKVPLSFQDE